MSSARDSPSSPPETSANTSPTDTRPAHPRYESITRENDREDSAPAGTVRRNRPAAISTNTGNYGMLHATVLPLLPKERS